MDNKERQFYRQLIQEWNDSRLDMFAVSMPDENFHFHGIIRFFYQEPGGKCTTKCIRVFSGSTTDKVIEELLERFRLNPTSAQTQAFELWEVHENGQQRRLEADEHPLLVQLGWSKEDQEGRFILRQTARKEEEQSKMASNSSLYNKGEDFKRAQPKRFSKNERKKRQLPGGTNHSLISSSNSYQLLEDQFPYTIFTRTISNPEMVLKKRREQKLDNRIRQLGNGGTLKIYGIELFPNRPYVSLLVSVNDSAKQIVQMALEKYGLEAQNPTAFVLVEIFLTEAEPSNRSYKDLRGMEKKQERLLRDDECPLKLLANLVDEYANVVFFLRQRPPSFPPTIMPKSITLSNFSQSSTLEMTDSNRRRHQSVNSMAQQQEDEFLLPSQNQQLKTSLLPCLVPINTFASSANFGAAALAIQPGITEIGSSSSCAIQLRAPSVLPRHCCLLYRHDPKEGPNVQISLLDKAALVELNGVSIHSTMELTDGVQLRIGGIYCYRFFSCVNQKSTPNSGQQQAALFGPYQSNSTAAPKKEEDGTQQRLAVPQTLHHQGSIIGGVRGGSSNSQPPLNRHHPFAASSQQLQSVDQQRQHRRKSEPNFQSNFFGDSAADTASNSGYVDFERPVPSAPVLTSTPSKPGSLASNEEMIVLNGNTAAVNMMGGGEKQQFHLHQHQQLRNFMGKQLPILLECLDQSKENELLQLELFGDRAHASGVGAQHFGAFRLVPAFTIYAICRHRLTHCVWDVQQRLNRNTFAKFIDLCNRTIKANLSVRDILVFWLANSSELLNMTRSDMELAQSVGQHLINELGQLVQNIYNLFVESCRQSAFCGIQNALNIANLANPNNEIKSGFLLSSLDECLRSVRFALLNPALTIQMFSQLFHFISASIFNWLVLSPEARPFINFQFGIRLKQLLQQIQNWAQKQGLELAAECHMDLMTQTVNLLTTPKSVQQIATLGATCYKLNSLQVRYLLENYMGDIRVGETPTVGREVVEHVVALARSQADKLVQRDGPSPPQLAESNCLQLPFLIPQDGYVVEKLRGIPPDMAAFVNTLQQRGLARVLLQRQGQTPIAEMPWNVFFSNESSTRAIITSTPIVGQRGPRSTTPVTMFPPTAPPPNIPPHFGPQQQAMAAAMRRKSESPVVYAEVRRPSEDQPPPQYPRCVSTSMLPAGNGHPYPHQNGNLLLKQQWNERMIDVQGQTEVVVQKVTIKRAPNEGLGLSIVEVATPGHGSGIYVKGVIDSSPAQKDGRIAAGDQLLSVNGQSLLGVQQEIAAQKIVSAGPVVHLEVAKKAAQRNGIAPYLQQDGIGQQTATIPNGNATNGQPNSMTMNGTTIVSVPKQQQQIQARPKSATELLQHQQAMKSSQNHQQADLMRNHVGGANGTVRSPVIYGTPNSPHAQQQYAQVQHSHQSSSSSQSSRLPAHYKPASTRPQVVLQPARPASSSPLNSRRTLGQIANSPSATQSDRSTPTPQQGPNQQQNFATVCAPPASMPVQIEQTADSPPINSSTTASTGSNNTVEAAREWQQQSSNRNNEQNGQQQFGQQPPSGRLSAPLFVGTAQEENGLLDELERQLDELDEFSSSEGGQLSDADQRRYRELLERLAKARKEKSVLAAGNSRTRLPPSMMAAAQQLERQSKSLAALSLDPAGRELPGATKLTSKSATNLASSDPAAQLRNSEAAKELVQEITEVVSNKARKQPPLVPAKPAIREFQRPPSAISFDSSANNKKRVQFSIHQQQLNNNNDENENHVDEREAGDHAGIEEEPRVQIVGAQEVYVNDPRQRRLQELQASQKLLKPVIDSSALGFREKMRMFAEQLGEKESAAASWKVPPNQHKTSSAEKQIAAQKETVS